VAQKGLLFKEERGSSITHRCSHLCEEGSRASFRNVVLRYKLDDRQRSKKEDCVSGPL
jgi:hypothetical protein